ncbi:MAG: DUF4406 domain-containing protein [Burkholderiaceae bacterium]|jgi:hypothetical protein|nr:DUF4406 domain-containing protein [Burkholderiaceae bacterium]
MKQKALITQPMAGKTGLQIRSERQRVTDILTRKGYEVLDHRLPDMPESGKTLDYVGQSLMLMSHADILVLMPGWESAKGCWLEYQAAKRYEIPTYLLEGEELTRISGNPEER